VFNRIKKFVESIVWSRRAYRFQMREWTRLHDLDGAAQLLNTVRFSRSLVPVQMPAPAGKRITVIAPHPDDEVIGPGGTLLLASENGAEVTVIFVTNGNAEEAAVRKQESLDICRANNWIAVHLDGVAGSLDADRDMPKRLTAAIAASQPDIVMVPYVLDDHDDHRRVNEFWLNGDRTAASKAEVWAYQVYSVVLPNIVVDISAARERKAALIARYASQMRRRDWANFALGRDAWSSRWLEGRKLAAWAEPFYAVPASDYLDHVAVYFQNNQRSYYR
jgi:N-acetylglucosamine malate deacetylase 1